MGYPALRSFGSPLTDAMDHLTVPLMAVKSEGRKPLDEQGSGLTRPAQTLRGPKVSEKSLS